MAGYSLEYGDDYQVAPNGGLALADGDVQLRQWIIRALSTNAREVLDDGTILDAEYIFHPTYGASLGRRVGRAMSATNSTSDLNLIENSIRVALATVPGVSKTQPAIINLRVVDGGVRAIINPVSAATNQPIAPIGLFIQQ